MTSFSIISVLKLSIHIRIYILYIQNTIYYTIYYIYANIRIYMRIYVCVCLRIFWYKRYAKETYIYTHASIRRHHNEDHKNTIYKRSVYDFYSILKKNPSLTFEYFCTLPVENISLIDYSKKKKKRRSKDRSLHSYIACKQML